MDKKPKADHLGRMISAVMKAAGGDYSVRLDTSDKNDEINALADAINNMLDSVREQIATCRQTEAAFRKSEERMRLFFERQIVGMAITSPEKGWLRVNDKLCEMLGYSRAELARLSWAEMTHPEDLARDVAYFNRLLAGEIDGYALEKRFLRKEGTVLHVNLSIGCVRRPDGSVDYLLALLEDITKRKQAEEALSKGGERLRQAVRVSHIGIFDHDHLIDTIYWSPEQREIHGWGPDEPITLPAYLDLVYPEDRERIAAAVRRAHDPDGDGLFDVDHRIVLRDGTIRWTTTRSLTFFDGEGGTRRPVRTVGAVRDITRQKQVEQLLKLTQFTIDQASLACFWVNSDSSLFYVNNQACRSLGYSCEELLSKSVRDIDPDFPSEAWPPFWQNIVQAKELRFETIHQRKDGSRFPVEITANYVKFDDKEYSCTFVRDITEHKRAEETLQMFQFSIEQAADAVFWMDRDGGFPYVNAEACRSLGYTREELMGLRLWDIDPFFPRERLDTTWAQFQKDGQVGSQHLESWHRRKDGVIFPVEVSSKHFWFGDTELHVAFVRDITERKTAESELHLTQFSLDQASLGIFRLSPDGRILAVNDQSCKNLGYTREELCSMTVLDINPGFSPERWLEHFQNVRTHGSRTFETIHRRKDGSTFPVEVMVSYLEFQGSEFVVSFVRDIAERRQAEEEKAKLESQLLQAQKMESVGRLAGGVAHDFNNMLSVILGYAELMKGRLPAGDPLLNDVLEIEKAGMHSRDITRQLLAFSRKQIIAPRPVDLNDLITSAQKTFARLIGEDIDLRFSPGKRISKVKIDPSQVDQILMNLAVNARDAMPEGGTLTIETANLHLDEAYCRTNIECAPGQYVLLEVSDDGVGMDKDTLSHVFEPFFTTKEVGKGTGLGLATVYGIVKQNNGFINVYSEPGRGTTFKIYFPRILEEETADKNGEAPVASGTGTILLVEDDDLVRGMTTAMLKELGYTILVAETPQHALSLYEKRDMPIDLLITDVVMPGMNGTELGDRIRSIQPEINVLFMSGYTSNVIVHHGVLEKGVQFVQKPFSMRDLARKVRDAMGGG